MERLLRRVLVIAACVVVIVSFMPWALPASGLAGSDWTKYLHDNAGSGFTGETAITATNASRLSLRAGWPMHGGLISVQPIVYNNRVFWGSWDGFMNAAPLSGSAYNWSLNFGFNANASCGSAGISSTADIVNVALGQTSAPYLIFGAGGNKGSGGGKAQMVAVDPATGAVQWRTPLADAPDTFMFSSPADYSYMNGSQPMQSVYIGLSSWCDAPLVQGKLVQLDAASGTVQNTFNVVPDGCLGGSIWGSPTIDASDGSLYFVTGNDGTCSSAEPYTFSIVKLRASDLSFVDSWHVPAAEQVVDSDFGSTPTLFKGTVWKGGPLRGLVGVANKNGTYYVFDRANLHQGPMARVSIAKPAEDPFLGGSISPSAWDGKRLYVAGGPAKVGFVNAKGSLRALDPNNLGKPIWSLAMTDGPVLAAVTAAPGIVVVGEGRYTVVVNSATGGTIAMLPVKGYLSSNPATFFGAPTISHGVLYEGDTHGLMYAYSIGGK